MQRDLCMLQFSPDDKTTADQWKKLFEVTQALMVSKVEEANEVNGMMEEAEIEHGKELAGKGKKLYCTDQWLCKYLKCRSSHFGELEEYHQ